MGPNNLRFKTVFQRAIASLQPESVDKAVLDEFQKSLSSRLSEHAAFSFQKLRRFGSFERETRIGPEIDLLLEIKVCADEPNAWQKGRNLILLELEHSLRASDTYLEMRRDRGSIAVFWKDLAFYVVPAFKTRTGEFLIPNHGANETWKLIAPALDAECLDHADRECSGELRDLIRLVKHWNRFHMSPLPGFLLESVAYHSAACGFSSLEYELPRLFHELLKLDHKTVASPSLRGNAMSLRLDPSTRELLEICARATERMFFLAHQGRDREAIHIAAQVFGGPFRLEPQREAGPDTAVRNDLEGGIIAKHRQLHDHSRTQAIR